MPTREEEQSKEIGTDLTKFLRAKKKPPLCRKCGRSFWGLKLYIDKYCYICWVNLVADKLEKKKRH